MKIKREIEVTICDFCKEEASAVCPICGKDVCRKHDLTLQHLILADLYLALDIDLTEEYETGIVPYQHAFEMVARARNGTRGSSD